MAANEVGVKRVEGEKNLRRYVFLPERLRGQRPNYVPPIWSDEHAFHDPDRNTALKDCNTVRFLAWQNGRCRGRIMGLVHQGHNRLHGEHTARFYQLDAEDDPEVSRALLSAVERWAREQGMERIIGPFGLSDKDPQGAQVQGFGHLPVIATPANPDFLPGHIEACGYAKFSDALSYRTPITGRLPVLYERIAERLGKSGEFRLVAFRSSRALRPWVVPVLRLVNETYRDLLGFVPMMEAEMAKLAKQYMPVLDPGLVKVVVDRAGEPAGFVVGVPDMSEGVRRANGRLFPFGFIHVMRAMRRSRQLDLLLGAVRPDLQGRGITCLLAKELLSTAHQRGFTHMDSHLVLETNLRMRAEVERLGGVEWKRYRVYVKDIGTGP
jgi:GNAT superfamily N-acetyltransferase